MTLGLFERDLIKYEARAVFIKVEGLIRIDLFHPKVMKR